MKINEIYLRKKLKVVVAEKNINVDNKLLVASMLKNIENLGYLFSRKLLNRLSTFTEKQLDSFYKEILPILKEMRGAHRKFNPMYPNFPLQVMEASEFELYANAILHYISFYLKDEGLVEDTWLPYYKKEKREDLKEKIKYDIIDLGNKEDFKTIFKELVAAKSSISQFDKEIIEYFISVYRDKVSLILPEQIFMREHISLVSGLLLKYTDVNLTSSVMSKFIKNPTDVLRIAVTLSNGDVSLATNTKFVNFKRNERRFLLSLLEKCNVALDEEMVKYRHRWIRLGEKLHPTEYGSLFPNTAAAFQKLRNEKIQTDNTIIEKSLKDGSVKKAVELLLKKPGNFARRLDHIFRISTATRRLNFSNEFLSVVDNVSTPLLLQLINHFKNRNSNTLRTIFPKGNLAKIQVLKNDLEKIDEDFIVSFVNKIEKVLIQRFKKSEPLGKVYLDEKLKNYLVPFSQRSASKALKTIVRGSKIDLDGDYNTIRFFIWWKNGNERVDLDLSTILVNENFSESVDIAYYNLKEYGAYHSGDITDAPKGACEFIDINMKENIENGYRYIIMCVNSFTNQKYKDLPECFAGWMGRRDIQSGEIFEAKTVKNKIDLTAETKIAIPLIIDMVERKVIWLDLSLKAKPTFNNVYNNKNNIKLLFNAMVDLKKTTLYDLFYLHAVARGKITKNKEKADIIFSETEGITPFDNDKIISQYL